MTAPTAAAAPRPGLLLAGKGKKNLKGTLTKVLAWLSFATGIVAGSLLASTFLGGIVDNILSFSPWDWVSVVILAGLFVATFMDLFSDGVPNRWALYSVMAMPSVARSVSGKLGNNVENWTGSLRKAVQGDLSAWLGTSSAIGLAVAAGLVAWLVSRRTMAGRAPKAMG